MTIGILVVSLQALQGIPVEEPTEVPADARLFLRNAKDDLREIATRAVGAQKDDGELAASGAKNAIMAALAAERLAVGTDDIPGDRYGDLVSIDVTSPKGHPDIVAVQFDIGIPCGSDAVFFLFRRDGNAWHLVLERREDDYERIAEGLGLFQWIASPSDDEGRFLVLTSTVSPWCVSAWQRLRYTVDRIEPGRDDAVPIDRGESGIYNFEAELKASPDSFGLSFAGSSFDTSVLVRDYQLNYKVIGDHALRVDPIADTPRAFVEEWLSMSAPDAAKWSALDSDDIDAWREEIGEDDLEFSEASECGEGTTIVRVVHWTSDEEGEEFAFTVHEEGNSYRLESIGATAECGAPR